MNDTSSPVRNSSTRMRLAALPNFFSSNTSRRYSSASAFDWTMTTPLPAASPSTLMTDGYPNSFSAALPSSTDEQTFASAVGMPDLRMDALQKAFEPSSS